MKVIVYSTHEFDRPYLEEKAGHRHELSFTRQPLNSFSAPLSEGFQAAALFSTDDGSAPVLDDLARAGIKYLTLRSSGFEHVDIAYAQKLGIRVANVSGYSPHAIAEHGVAMLMTLNRKIILGQKLMDRDDFRIDQLVGFNLHKKTVGIIGTGRIGSVLAKIMHGFGCQLIGYDPSANKELIKSVGMEYTDFSAVCEASDVIFITCPLNEMTYHMLNKRAFDRMKESVTVINLGRGGIVNSMDLLEALEDKRIGAAGLDVYEHEKNIFFKYHGYLSIQDQLLKRLRSLHNVLITGHQAFLTHEAIEVLAEKTIENLDKWESELSPGCELTPQKSFG